MLLLGANYIFLILLMKQTFSYISINEQELKSLYKFYYIKQLTKNLIPTKSSTLNETCITFVFYGTMIAMTPIKRIECNAFFNKKKDNVIIKFSIRSYSKFKSLICFSNLNQIKVILKGDVFYQIEVNFNKNRFDKNITNFEIQTHIYTAILSWFDQYISLNIQKSKKNLFFPSIICIPIEKEITSFIRYSSIYTWINKHDFSSYKPLSIGLIQILNYNQIQLISVLIYNKNKKISLLFG